MKQLTNVEHLVYQLPNAHLVTSLPFIDQELDNQIPKSKVAYLIAAQQKTMNNDPQKYIEGLKTPELTYVGSEEFKKQVQRIQTKIEQKKDKNEGVKKAQVVFPQLPKKIAVKDLPEVAQNVKKGVISYEILSTKNLTLEIYKKLGPLVMKQMIDVLEREKANLQSAVERESEAIERLNKDRKYEQLQTYQREYDIGERIKIMLNKRRKVE